VIGILGLIAGLVVIRRPGESLLALVVIIGVWLVVTGSSTSSERSRGSRTARCGCSPRLVDVILGILILALPKLSLGTLAILVGLAFLIRGVVAVVSGIGLRRAAGAAEESASSALTA
jgi:uncharacterized membrane protein HdeD (DUF308 family)